MVVDELHCRNCFEEFLGRGGNFSLASANDQASDGVLVCRGICGRGRRGGCSRCQCKGGVGSDLVGVGPFGIAANVVDRALVFGIDHAISADSIHKAGGSGIHDGGVKAGTKGGSQEGRAQKRARRKAKAHIGNAEGALHAQALLDHAYGTQDFDYLSLIGGGGHDQAVDENTIAGDAVTLALIYDAFGNGKALLGRLGDTVLVERQTNHVGAVVSYDGQDLVHDLALAVDRVDDGLSGIAARCRLDGGGVGRVDLQGQQRGTLELFACRLDHLDLVDLGKAHVDIEDVGALLLLADALGYHVVEVAVA